MATKMQISPTNNKKSIWVYLATCFPLGNAPFAPGSFGSLLGLAMACGLKPLLPELRGPVDFIVLTGVVLVLSALAWWIIAKAQGYFAKHDDPSIVIDEVVGQLLAIIYFPLTAKSVVIGFLLFRLFDIVKPWPISFVDKRVPGAFGVLFDDILAGIAAALVLFLALIFHIH